jgi:hypothetical protein
MTRMLLRMRPSRFIDRACHRQSSVRRPARAGFMKSSPTVTACEAVVRAEHAGERGVACEDQNATIGIKE